MNYPALPDQGGMNSVQYWLFVTGCEAVSGFCSPYVPKGGSLGPHRSYWPVGLFLCGPRRCSWIGDMAEELAQILHSSRPSTSAGGRG